MSSARTLTVVAVAALAATLVQLAGAFALAATSFDDPGATYGGTIGRLRLATVTQQTAGPRLALPILLAAIAIVVLVRIRPDLGALLPTTTFAVALAYTALTVAGVVNFLVGYEGPSTANFIGAAVWALGAVPLGAAAAWLTAPGRLSAAGTPPDAGSA